MKVRVFTQRHTASHNKKEGLNEKKASYDLRRALYYLITKAITILEHSPTLTVP